MGYFQHRAALAVFEDEESAREALEEFSSRTGEGWREGMREVDAEKGPSRILSLGKILVFPPDGSKWGWSTNTSARQAREEFAEECSERGAAVMHSIVYDEEGSIEANRSGAEKTTEATLALVIFDYVDDEGLDGKIWNGIIEKIKKATGSTPIFARSGALTNRYEAFAICETGGAAVALGHAIKSGLLSSLDWAGILTSEGGVEPIASSDSFDDLSGKVSRLESVLIEKAVEAGKAATRLKI